MSARLEPLTGFRYVPAAGLVPLEEFYGSLADRVFHSTQYIRHWAAPLYTPEPDLIHEVIGHGNLLASPEFAELNLLAGQAARRCETKEALRFLAHVFWFTIEFGVLHEDGELRAYGAGILSSYGEIEEFRAMEIRPIDYLEMGTIDYDITQLPAGPLQRRVDDPPDGVAGRVLRRLRRRHAGAVRRRARPPRRASALRGRSGARSVIGRSTGPGIPPVRQVVRATDPCFEGPRRSGASGSVTTAGPAAHEQGVLATCLI